MISWSYKNTPRIEAALTAWGQLETALIQIGDEGVLKGHFTIPEAEEVFYKILPLFNETVENPDSAFAVEAAKQMTEMARPIWGPMLKADDEQRKLIKEMMDELEKELSRMPSGKAGKKQDETRREAESAIKGMMSSGDGEDGKASDSDSEDVKSEGESKPSDKATARRRKAAAAAEARNKAEEAKKKAEAEAKKGGSSSDSSDEEKAGEGAGKSSEDSESSSSSEKDDEAEVEGSDGTSGEKSDDISDKSSDDSDSSSDSSDSSSDKEKTSESSSSSSSTGEKRDSDDPSDMDTPEGNPDADADVPKMPTDDDIEDDEYSIDADTIKNIREDIERAEKTIEKEDEMADREPKEVDLSSLPDGEIESDVIHDYTAINRKVNVYDRDETSELYEDIIDEVKPLERSLVRALKDIFKPEDEEIVPYTRGKYNIVRGTIGTTARIFDRKIVPGDGADAAVFLLVDQSGSMHSGTRISQARNTAIILAEAFAEMHIPCYCMGFTANFSDGEPVNNHFVSWRNTLAERQSLAGMDAEEDNFDGYSIRYAGKMLNKRPERNKILFVISDGCPLCECYRQYGYRAGLNDTKAAIKELQKTMQVFGVLLGDDCRGEEEEIQDMYGQSFAAVPDNGELDITVIRKMIRSIKIGLKRHGLN